MKIIRDGKEIELTAKEMQDAYYEQQHKYDIDDITGWVMESFSDSDNKKYREIVVHLKDEDFCDRMAYRYRTYLDEVITGEDEVACWIDAGNYTLHN